jgi:hypothetical protein
MLYVLQFLLNQFNLLMDGDTLQLIRYCIEEQSQKYYLSLSSYIADYPEQLVLQYYGYGLCPWYKHLKDKLDDQINSILVIK